MMLFPVAALPRLVLKALGMENSWHSGKRRKGESLTPLLLFRYTGLLLKQNLTCYEVRNITYSTTTLISY